ncbi:unknown [Odoribacter splanchnicus CAG:14]|nr:unknown [Odoribacter splanchnicus CAG:14]
MTGSSFNSTLVQLKVAGLWSETALEDCFNSTLVQLKDWNMKMWRQKYRCFNSTLVQLKAVKNANKYTSKSMIYHPFILIFYKHLQSTFNS